MMFGINKSNVTKIELKNFDGTVVGTIGISKANTTKKKKRLQYNFKELSTQIMRTKTSGSARQTAVKAKQKVALLRSKLRTEDYDDREIESAITHAEKMERVARRRMRNLQAEEEAKRQGEDCQEVQDEDIQDIQQIRQECQSERDAEKVSYERLQELTEQMQEFQESMEDVQNETLSQGMLDELMPVNVRDMKPEDLDILKKKHRADEMRDIMIADLQYLRDMFGKLAKEQQEASSGVSLELGGMEVPVSAVPAESSAAAAAEAAVEGAELDVLV